MRARAGSTLYRDFEPSKFILYNDTVSKNLNTRLIVIASGAGHGVSAGAGFRSLETRGTSTVSYLLKDIVRQRFSLDIVDLRGGTSSCDCRGSSR